MLRTGTTVGSALVLSKQNTAVCHVCSLLQVPNFKKQGWIVMHMQEALQWCCNSQVHLQHLLLAVQPLCEEQCFA